MSQFSLPSTSVSAEAPKPKPTASKPQGGFRQSMAWLHTWFGLWFSWLLYCVFLTGTLGVFEEPITHWMSPEHALQEAHHGAVPPATQPGAINRAQRLAFGLDYMAKEHSSADMWELWPVNRNQDNGLVVYWFDRTGGYASMGLDATNGQPLPPSKDLPQRATFGGHHFVDFHYELHAGTLGLWVVGFAAMGMLLALVSGVVIHKRIFKDFFTFRPKKGQRSWLDAHNAVAVLTLPFQFMIAYTGLAISAMQFMPTPVVSEYGMGRAAMAQYVSEVNEPGKPVRTGQLFAVPDLDPFVARAENLIGQQVRAVVIDNPGDSSARIGVYGWNEDEQTLQRISATTGMVQFSAATGEILQIRQPGSVDGGAPQLTRQVMGDLHMATFGGLAVKWLYFVCGLAGTAMMATGAILFVVKRRAKHGKEFGAATARMYRLIEGLNVAAIAGLALACVGYLWANRLIPTGIAHRDDYELWAFFAVWALALVHAFVRLPARAWREQLAALAALCLLLPVLNLMTVGDHLFAQIARGDWESAGVELTVLVFGGLAAWSNRHASRKRQAPAVRQPKSSMAALADTESA